MYMFKIFSKEAVAKSDKNSSQILYKELFSASNQKKNVSRAARESADDQKRVVEKYLHEMEASQA